MFYAAIAKLNPGTVTVYEGNDMAELATKFAGDNGGHAVLADENARIPVYSGKAYLSRHDGDAFWTHVMSDVMTGRDNDDYFYGSDRAEVVSQAEAFLAGNAE